MKEAAGEANMTVITIVLIGIVLLIGTFIVTRLMNNLNADSDSTPTCGTGYTWNSTTGTCDPN